MLPGGDLKICKGLFLRYPKLKNPKVIRNKLTNLSIEVNFGSGTRETDVGGRGAVGGLGAGEEAELPPANTGEELS